VVVVDNASRDEGLAGVRARHPRVRWIMNRENLGYARGVNHGMAAAPAEYHLILNPDIVVSPGAVDALLAFAESRPRAGIVGPQLLNEDGTIQDSCRRFYTFRTLLLRRTILGQPALRSRAVEEHLMRDFDHRSERAVDWVLGGCLLVRRAAMERVGPLDERFFLYFEDVDWCTRMWRAGWEVLYFPGARFTHRHRRESARGALHRGFWLHLSSLISFYEKWGMVVWLLKRWRAPFALAMQWVVDMGAVVGAMLAAYSLRSGLTPFFGAALFPLADYLPLFVYTALVATFTFMLTGHWSHRRDRRPIVSLVRDVALITLLLLASTTVGRQHLYSRAVMLLFAPLAVLTLGLAAALRQWLQRRLERGGLALERTVLVGEPARVSAWLTSGAGPRANGIDAVGYLARQTPGAGHPPLGRGDVPWLGEPAEAVKIVERWRVTQVAFWGLDGPEEETRSLVDELRRRGVRLRWLVAGAWLPEAGGRAEPFGAAGSVVLEPVANSRLGRLLRRLSPRGDREHRRPGPPSA
jgi:GT2 family glycosyltransferase